MLERGGKPRKPLPPPLAGTLIGSMTHRYLLKPIIVLALSLLILYSLITHSFSPFPTSSVVVGLAALPPHPPAKVYVYELPEKFTTGVVRSYFLARSAPAALVPKYPGHQHSAEWYLLKDLDDPAHSASRARRRVSDPDEADIFYVPFFSSLSLIVNPIRPDTSPADPSPYSDEAMQDELLDWLEAQPYWGRNNGRDHVFICQDPNALYKVMDRIRNSVLLLSDFGRLKDGQGSLVKDVILPYSHRINSYKGKLGVDNRPSLLFFMGNRFRKEGGKIRDTLFQILEEEKDVIIKHGAQSRESRRMATHGMHSSKFCLHPAGDTPSACRLFDAIVSLCVPVIVSDYIELPFEDAIDYRKIAIFIDTNSAVRPGYLTSKLRSIGSKRILEYQRELKAVKPYFEYEDPDGTVDAIWFQISSKLPLIKLMSNRDKRRFQRALDGRDCSCLCDQINGTSTSIY